MIVLIILSIILIGYLGGLLFEKIKLPKLLGYLLFGIGFSFIYRETIIVDFTTIITSLVLAIILFKAGLGIDIKTLKQVGFRSLLLGTIPNLLEGFILTFIAYFILGFSFAEAGMFGFIISAVSPAVVVPLMTKLKDENLGTNKGIPTMNLAAASFDDIVSLTMFGLFADMYVEGSASLISIIMGPVSIILGIGVGILIGMGIATKKVFKNNKNNSNIIKYILMIFLILLIKQYGHYIYISEMITIMTIGITISYFSEDVKEYSLSYTNKVWGIGQILLFFLIGILVDLSLLKGIGMLSVLIIIIGLLFRYIGVLLCLIKSDLNKKERTFLIFANTPKATVQATLGAIPLYELGAPNGELILSISVLAIILTAPLGLLLTDKTKNKLLT